MLTPEGAAWLWRNTVAEGSLSIVVSDGAQEASAVAEIKGIEVDDDGAVLTLLCAFGPDDANFEWRKREVRTKDGTVLDSLEEDQGRKAPGSEWSMEVSIELSGENDD